MTNIESYSIHLGKRTVVILSLLIAVILVNTAMFTLLLVRDKQLNDTIRLQDEQYHDLVESYNRHLELLHNIKKDN